jgi:hypothetical protein
MLPVPAKSSETRAILLLILAHTEHLWIQIKNVFVKARKTSKINLVIEWLRSTFPVLQPTVPKSGVEKWLRSPKRKSLVVSIRKPMSEGFELTPKREHLSTRLQS